MRKIITLILLLFGQTTFGQLTSVQIAEITEKSVVVIKTYDNYNNLIGQGSGVVISNDGKIITNYHVFKGGNYMIVENGGLSYHSQDILKFDHIRDYLIFTIEKNSLRAMAIGNSDSLKKGEQVYAIGSPKGRVNSITQGIISAIRTEKFDNDISQNYIQHDAAISLGSSGGALVNIKGELVAVNVSQITEAQNINFAIQINEISDTVKNFKGNYYYTVPETENSKGDNKKNENPIFKNYTGPKIWSVPTNPNYNSYGNGNGQITVYSNCSDCLMNVYIDNEFIGRASKYFTTTPICGQYGTVSSPTRAGRKTVYAKDNFGNEWSLVVNVPIGECVLVFFKYEPRLNNKNFDYGPLIKNDGPLIRN